MTALDPSAVAPTGATMDGVVLCSICQHEAVRHGPEAGGCIECRCRVEFGALARASALVAGDPDWMSVTRWPRAAAQAEE